MQFEGRRRSTQAPNLTPLIDIVFLLLVFFMLTSHFVQEQSLNIELPVADSGDAVGEDSRLEVVIAKDGRLLINDHFVADEALLEVLRTALAGQGDKQVRIRGDRTSPLGRSVTVLDAARRAGASGVDIVSEQK
ncbi:MAG: biopolymer transporter ExbD [Gammaproteobacteria bacterium]|nr:biopolymer transporter ExbD [Gammaproteobacteria bacterium]